MTQESSSRRYIELSAQDFAALGADQIAYVKRIVAEGDLHFEIHAADGTTVAMANSVDVAFAAVRQNGLEPLSVH